jgi:hypothetical protein
MALTTERRDGFDRPYQFSCGRGIVCPVCNPELIGDPTVADRLRPYVVTAVPTGEHRSLWAKLARGQAILNRSRAVRDLLD